jgi:tetratricopeptide (TPR) repeat protein
MPATKSLLTRATALLPSTDSLRTGLLVDLGLTLQASDDVGGAVEVLSGVITEAEKVGDRRIETRARIELAYMELQRQARKTADDLLDATAVGIPLFEAAGDHRSTGRALVLSGWVRGGRRGIHEAQAAAAERALVEYEKARWSVATCLGELAAALYWGPVPIDEAIARCEQLLRDHDPDLAGRAYILTFLGGMNAQRDDFGRARDYVDSARSTLEDLGLQAPARIYWAHVLSEIELLAQEHGAAERLLREICETWNSLQLFSRLASTASELADVLVHTGAIDEAEEWTTVAERYTADDDLHAQVRWYPVRAKIHGLRGELERARDAAQEGARLSKQTDDLNRRAKVHGDLAHVLRLVGDEDAARIAASDAVRLYTEKGNVVAAEALARLADDPALV